MPTLYIAEKPSLGRAIAEVIGIARNDGKSILLKDGSRMTWAFGHLLELAEPDTYLSDDIPRSQKTGRKIWRKEDLPIVPDSWKMLAKDKEIAAHIKQIHAWLKEVDSVCHCGDPDREGQAIVDNILVTIKNQKPVKRLWVQDLTDNGIRKALSSMKDNRQYDDLFQSALARSRADWLVGMNLTRAATLSNSGGGLVSIGRVQTPTLSLIVNRDLAIEKFVPIDHYGVKATLEADPDFESIWQIPENLKSPEGYLLDKAKAASIVAHVAGQTATVKSVVQKDGKKAPPLLFSLSALQKYASARLGMGAQQVLDTAQSLYEKHKATSYPRTDCQYVAENQHNDAPALLDSLREVDCVSAFIDQTATSRKSAVFNDKKITAHTAIIPTGVIPTGLSPMEQKLYDVIVKFYVAQFMPDQTFKNTTITLDIQGHTFVAKGKVILNAGWTVLFGAVDEETDEDSNGALPNVTQGQTLNVIGADVQAKQTKPPARFTEGTLIEAMSSVAKYIDDPEAKKILKETEGLGTEATRANVIETLKKRGFIEAKGKQIISTEKGRGAIQVVPASMRDPVTTAKWESRLEAISSGEETLATFLQAQTEFVKQEVLALSKASINLGGNGKVSEPVGKCPCCGGDVVETPKAYSCSKYKETGCKFAIWKDMAGKKLSATVVKQLLEKGMTSKEVTGFKSKAGKDFSAKLALENGKVVFKFDNQKKAS